MQEKVNKIYNGNNLDVLKGFQDNSCDALVSDFPYALSFMNAKWDTMPRLEMLKEFYRVLKAGAFLVTTFTPRLDLQSELCMLLKEAGFDVSFSPLYWAYKSGFPKASNYSKVIQKNQGVPMEVVGEYKAPDGKGRGGVSPQHYGACGGNYEQGNRTIHNITKPTTPEAKYCDGLYSLSMKPAVEPILIAQKPHNKAKYKQALDWYYERKELLDKGIPEEDLSLYTKNASGGVFFDNTRIPIDMNDKNPATNPLYRYQNQDKYKQVTDHGQRLGVNVHFTNSLNPPNENGRFPANLLCGFPISKEELRSEYPEATEEELDKMVSMIENPIDVGRVSKSGKMDSTHTRHTDGSPNGIYGKFNINHPLGETHGDQGDLSRYFSLTAWSKKHFPNLHNIAEKTLQLQDDAKKTGDLLFTAKPSQSEKNAGLDGFEEKNVKDGRQAEVDNAFQRGETLRQNTHPTTKPISLYNYLITLFSKEGDIILDPFCGSGVTPIACVLTNRRYIGCEMEAEYCKIAEARVEYWRQQKEGVKIPYASTNNLSASISTLQESQESLF